MGGIGHHPVHPYALQSAAFIISLLMPGGVFALLLGGWWEGVRRGRVRKAKSHEMTARVGAWLAQAE